MSGTDVLLVNREMEEWRWLQLMNQRLDAILPFLKSYSLPKLEEVLEVRYFLGSSGPLGSGQGVTKPAKDFDPPFNNHNYSFDTRGIFALGDVTETTINYWGLTMKGDWLLVKVHQVFRADERGARATSVGVEEVDLAEIEDQKGAKQICELLDQAVQYWQERHGKLFAVIGEFNQQRELLKALKA